MGPCQTQIILAERLCNVNSFEAEPFTKQKTGAFRNCRSQGRKIKQGGICNEVSEFYSAV